MPLDYQGIWREGSELGIPKLKIILKQQTD